MSFWYLISDALILVSRSQPYHQHRDTFTFVRLLGYVLEIQMRRLPSQWPTFKTAFKHFKHDTTGHIQGGIWTIAYGVYGDKTRYFMLCFPNPNLVVIVPKPKQSMSATSQHKIAKAITRNIKSQYIFGLQKCMLPTIILYFSHTLPLFYLQFSFSETYHLHVTTTV